MLRIALYQPDIAANAAAAMRLAACLAIPLLIVEPCGFVWDRKRVRRVALDYAERAEVARFPSWGAFAAWRAGAGARLVLLTTQAGTAYHEVAYRPGDVLLAGRESSGVPDEVAAAADAAVAIPMAAGCRSLNVVSALAIVLGEALRQTRGWPAPPG